MQPESAGPWYRMLATDLREFGIDVCSCAVRILFAWKLMLLFAVGGEIAFSTALMLGGTRVFDKSTNWMSRTRTMLRSRTGLHWVP